ncbi:putative phosphoserine aminotransferase, chloroplastic-like [Capsicum annuum]|nr:putative phosphoserine aminotransferase, chloroplastic-like [Capsicum annuum]
MVEKRRHQFGKSTPKIGKFTNSPTMVGEGNLGVFIMMNTYSTWKVRQEIIDVSRRLRRSLGSASASASALDLDLDLDLSNDRSMRSIFLDKLYLNYKKFQGKTKNYILSGLQDDLYNIYSGTKTSKELWGALEQKYNTEDAGIKKFLIARFLDFKIIDSKCVVSQVQELRVIIHDLLAEVATIVEKLRPLWKDIKNYLKHKRKNMTVEDLIVRLQIEENNKAFKRRSKGNSTINGAHIIEDGQNNSKKRKRAEQGSNQPKKKFKGKCFNYGKIGHKFKDCRTPKKGKKKDQANMIESNKECDDLCAMFSECNLVGNPREWWMNSGATRHVCANKELFSSFSLAQAEEMIYITNSATAKICIARSVMESKSIALDKAGEEVEWLRNYSEDIPYWPKPVVPVCIHYDSQAAIGRAGSMMYNGKSRHIQQIHNTVRELLSSGIITIDYVKSNDKCRIHLQKAYLQKKWKGHRREWV